MRDSDSETQSYRAEQGKPENPTDGDEPSSELPLGSFVRGIIGSEGSPESGSDDDTTATERRAAEVHRARSPE